MLSTVAEIIRDLLIFVGVIAALLIALIVVVSKLPDTNPLKRILTALCYRLGATLAAGAITIPLEPIPGIDLAYDIGVPMPQSGIGSRFSRMLAALCPTHQAREPSPIANPSERCGSPRDTLTTRAGFPVTKQREGLRTAG